jgi:hypothetical protein
LCCRNGISVHCSDAFGLHFEDSQDEDSEDNGSGLSWTKAIEACDGTRTEKEGKATLTHTGGAGDSGGGLGGGGPGGGGLALLQVTLKQLTYILYSILS